MNNADKEIEIMKWMQKAGYDRRACKDIAPIILKYIQAAPSPKPTGGENTVENAKDWLRINHKYSMIESDDELTKAALDLFNYANSVRASTVSPAQWVSDEEIENEAMTKFPKQQYQLPDAKAEKKRIIFIMGAKRIRSKLFPQGDK